MLQKSWQNTSKNTDANMLPTLFSVNSSVLQFLYSIQSIRFLPLILCHVIVAEGKAGYSTCASPQQCFPGLVGGCRGVPRSDEIYNPSSDFWAYPRVFLQLDMPQKTSKETTSAGSFQQDGCNCPSSTPYHLVWAQPPYGAHSFRAYMYLILWVTTQNSWV